MKILSIIDIPWNSGLAYYAFEQAKALRGGGHTVTFACPEGSAAMRFAEAGGFARFAIPGRKQYFRFPGAVAALARLARSEKFDFVCAHTGLAQTFGWLLKTAVPSLALIRVKADAKRPTAGFTFSSVDRVISGSAYIEEQYLDAGLDPAKSSLIRQGIEVPPFEHPPAPPPYRIGILGRLDPVKGHACFLKAAAEVLRSGVDAEFHIAGYESGIKYADLKILAENEGILPRVVLHGKVADSAAFMRDCNIGVIASLGSEAVSRAALEWLACGRPLVSTSAGSLPEFARRDLLAAPGDHKALARKILDLVSSPDKLADAGPLNREKALEEFSIKNFEEATCWLFESAAVPRR